METYSFFIFSQMFGTFESEHQDMGRASISLQKAIYSTPQSQDYDGYFVHNPEYLFHPFFSD